MASPAPRRRVAPLLLALLAGLFASVVIASCGGSQISADEVEAAPPELTIPTQGSGSADVLADPAGSATTDPSGASATDPDAEPSDSTSTSGSQTSEEPAAGATSTPSGPAGAATPQPQGTPAQPDPGGTQAPAQSGSTGSGNTGGEKFEEFCQQNAGAC